MEIRAELKEKLAFAVERLYQKVKVVQRAHPEIKLGETEALRPADYVDDDPLRSRGNTEWEKLIDPENSALNDVIREILAEAPATDPAKMAELNNDNLWVWGGPTPFWGGSMADDTLVRGADYYNAGNVVYVYGPTNDKCSPSTANTSVCSVRSMPTAAPPERRRG